MGTMTPQKLLQQWTLENLTTEMATGHTLQNLVKIQRAIDAINLTLYNLRSDVDNLIVHTGMKQKTRKKRPAKANLSSPASDHTKQIPAE